MLNTISTQATILNKENVGSNNSKPLTRKPSWQVPHHGLESCLGYPGRTRPMASYPCGVPRAEARPRAKQAEPTSQASLLGHLHARPPSPASPRGCAVTSWQSASCPHQKDAASPLFIPLTILATVLNKGLLISSRPTRQVFWVCFFKKYCSSL